MSVSVLSTSWSLGLIIAVVVCAVILVINVKKETAGRKATKTPALKIVKQPALAPTQRDGLTIEQILAVSAYCWLHPEQTVAQLKENG